MEGEDVGKKQDTRKEGAGERGKGGVKWEGAGCRMPRQVSGERLKFSGGSVRRREVREIFLLNAAAREGMK